MRMRWYQDEAIQALFDYFSQHDKPQNPVVALPTGTGKSVVIAGFIVRALACAPWTRILLLTHVKELVAQNAAKLRALWPDAPVGIRSAGLGETDTAQPIIFGGVASVIGCVEMLGHRDLLIIDECQLVGTDEASMYIRIISLLKLMNPKLKVIGLSATPYRMGVGMLTDGGIFTDIVYDLTDVAGWARLLADNFLCPPLSGPTKTKFDLSQLKMRGGEFTDKSQQAAFDNEQLTHECVAEYLERGEGRNCSLIFASGVQHAEHICDMLQSFGETATFVHSKLKGKGRERDDRIAAFKAGEYRHMVNNGILTTGFDHPPIDLLGFFRATMSVPLWVQMVGRGTRPYDFRNPGDVDPAAFPYVKENVMVCDFAANAERLGPVNDPRIPKKKGEGGGDAPVRICDRCEAYNHASARFCGGEPFRTPSGCGHEFINAIKIDPTEGGNAAIMTDVMPEVHYFEVTKVLYNLHIKNGAPDSMKVSYFCGLRHFSKYVCLEHGGYAKKQAKDWWRDVAGTEPPTTTKEALDLSQSLRVPAKIRVWVNKKYPEIMSYEY